MYKFYKPSYLAENANKATTQVITRGVSVYIDVDPDFGSAEFTIDPADEKGIALFREFAAKMADHYKSLSNG